ncbi:MAG: ABC transporter ATP-binding protein [Lachnospiraceae bacterium]|nr:ABC transporter ATP-binding protein [Lachnospiraceae bacterium]
MEKEKKYTLFGNIRYAYKTLFKKCGWMRLCVPGTVLTHLGNTVLHTVTLSVLVASITEHKTEGHFMLSVSGLLLAYVVFYYLDDCIGRWSSFYYENTQNREFLMRLVRKTMTADYENVESPSKQRMLLKATHAVHMYRQGVNQMYSHIPYVVSNILGMVLYALTITFIDYRILLVILGMFFLNTFLDSFKRKYIANTMDDQYRIWGRFHYLTQQSTSVPNGKDIRIYNMAEWIKSGFDRLVGKNKELTVGKMNRVLLSKATETVLTAGRDILAYVILIVQVLEGRITIAEFTLGLSVVTGLSGWLGGIRYHIGELLEGNQMMCRYREMMDYPNTFLREEGKTIPKEWREGKLPEIEFRHVSFRYEDCEEDILKDVSFTIKPGERIALVGHNGAGKTTLVKLLCGFYHPTAGEILIGGCPLEELNLNEYHELLATIFQDVNTLPVSIAGNVSGKTEEETDLEKVKTCLMRAGLWKDVEAMEKKEFTAISQALDPEGIQLSGGMVQKLMLARCIYKDAPILVLDEPTAALDPIAESNMYLEYDKITKNKSALFISHRLASTKFCDRILFMEQGRIIEDGTHEELLRREGKYAEMFAIQSEYYKEGGEVHEGALA